MSVAPGMVFGKPEKGKPDKVKIGFIGVGGRGRSHLHNILKRDDGEFAAGSGHGGMDFFVDHAFIETVKRKALPPIDVYDAAAWSAITPLSERSLAEGNMPQAFPDF